MSDAELLLKSTPPRLSRTALPRARLGRFRDEVAERAVLLVTAPAGFGKTTQMLQWRRHWLELGAPVAWLDLDERDEPERFARGLLQAFRTATGRNDFTPPAGERQPAINMVTTLLAAIAGRGTDTVLMLDQAERLPAATLRTIVPYLLGNAPANLRVVIGSREPLPLRTAEHAASGDIATLSADDLRLRQEETLDILAQRSGVRLALEDGVRLHGVSEGWPLGLQLALAAIEHEPDPSAAVRRLSARRGQLQDYFVDSLADWLPAGAIDFLVRVSMLDHLDAGLCRAVTGEADAAGMLDLLLRRTPLLMVDERHEWFRLHPLARDFLLARFEALPHDQRSQMHARASHWYADHGLLHEAARHALESGDEDQAHRLAVQSLWALGTQGRLTEAGRWLEHLPPEMLAQDITQQLVVGWIHALSDRNGEALKVAMAVVDDPAATPAQRAVALRVAGGAAMYTDRLDLFSRLVALWPADAGPFDDPLYLVAPLNGQAYLALHAGCTADSRALVERVLRHGDTGSLRLAAAFARIIVALGHLVDGDALQAEAVLRPALARAESEDGRRGTIASMYAAVLAGALLERDQPGAAQALLADRLDVIDSAPPDVLLLAYRTLARAALAGGDERRALNVLGSLESIGQRRGLPRLRLHSLVEQIRLHAMQGRLETVERLVRTLDRFEAALPADEDAPLLGQARLAAAIARAHAAFARDDLDTAAHCLEAADALAAHWHRNRDTLTIRVLRALVLHDQGDRTAATRLLSESLGLAAIGGLSRLLPETHPRAVALAEELLPTGRPPAASGNGNVVAMSAPAAPGVRSDLLTTKEAEIVDLLGRGMSNKEIARVLDVSAETVKWHLKNLFAKLSAGTRRHAVERARLLGLIAS